LLCSFFALFTQPTCSTLFPYTTLFRSRLVGGPPLPAAARAAPGSGATPARSGTGRAGHWRGPTTRVATRPARGLAGTSLAHAEEIGRAHVPPGEYPAPRLLTTLGPCLLST